ncbi:MAG: amino acid adenylation domain-containing protein [Acidobacteriota bacterium]
MSEPSNLLSKVLELSPERLELLALRLRGASVGAEPSTRIPLAKRPATGEAHFPLSFTQERLWFLDRLEPGIAAYNEPSLLRLRGELDEERLRRAVQGVVARHEILRTTFRLGSLEGGETEGETPVQVVASEGEIPLPVVDLRGQADGEAEALRQAMALGQESFRLETGPLLRLALYRVAEAEALLLVVFHHIIADGWSFGIFFREVAALYQNPSSAPLSATLPSLPLQYGDYAAWQRQTLAGEALEERVSFWREALAGAPMVLDLPADRPRPAQQSFAGTRHTFALEPAVAEGLESIARKAGSSLYTALLSAFATLLHRYTGRTRMLLGTPTANRPERDLESLVGFFANTLVLHNDLRMDPPFEDLVRRQGPPVRDSLAHGDLPFERLVEALQPPRDLSRSPLFQVMFTYHTADLARPGEVPGLAMEPVFLDKGICQFDLTLSLWQAPEGGEGLKGEVEYATALFDATTVQRFIGHFLTLAAGAAAEPRQPLSRLPLLTPAEQTQLVETVNETAWEPVADQTFAQIFARQVERAPEATALLSGDQRLSYRELAAATDALAVALMERGVGPERVVAIHTDRGPEQLVAMLAAFRLGAAYLPLDPHHPPQRRAEMLLEGAARWLLTTADQRSAADEIAARAAESGGGSVELVEVDFALTAAEPLPSVALPPLPTEMEHLAYVIFTSGSTGKPKGAMVIQRGMMNHLRAKVRDLELTAKDVVAQNASPCFDIAVWQFLVALSVGGTTRVLPDEEAHDPERLLAATAAGEVTVLETVPSMLRLTLDQLDQADQTEAMELPLLRWMIATGEALPPELVRRWLEAYPTIPVLNAYGPTECSDDVTHHILRTVPPRQMVTVPIGSVLLHTRLYLVDSHGNPLPVGVPGELWVGGIGVGRGYLRDPRRTAIIFIPDPFATIPEQAGGRLYRTGDVVRRQLGGALEFLGREDNQVKIRGVRIELAEIETALAELPGVRQAVVLAAGDKTAGETRLAAYLEVEEGVEEPTVADLRGDLLDRLPGYMVPAAFGFVSAMPLTANGKIDRTVLAALETEEATTGEEYAPPETEVEEAMVLIFQDLLAVERVGVFDSFFTLGGHSLLATQLVSRVRRTFEVELPLTRIFAAPTVAELAADVEERLIEELMEVGEE